MRAMKQIVAELVQAALAALPELSDAAAYVASEALHSRC